MSESLFTGHEYGDVQTDKAALLVAGFMSTVPEQLENAATTLVDQGFNVYGYDFSPEVFTEGDPELLPTLIDELTTDFVTKTQSYSAIQPCGVSIGAGIAWETQKREPLRAAAGVYAAAGADSADGIFSPNPIMFGLRRAFTQRGYDHQDLKERWAELHTPPITGFTIALGGLDYIVRYPDITRKIRSWRNEGVPIMTKTVWRAHTGTIRWYDQHLDQLLP